VEIPWTSKGEPAAAHVMASRFELKSALRSPAFLFQALRIWRQARRSPGLLGVSLRAYPVSGVFWTLSAWTGEDTLPEFMRTDPHRTIMKQARPWTKTAVFRTRDVPAGKLSPAGLWASAELLITEGGPAQ
jgi:hypothetical protein